MPFRVRALILSLVAALAAAAEAADKLRNAGFVQNGMGVWCVPEERLDECGRAIHENCYVLKLASSMNAGEGIFSNFPDRHAQKAVPRFRS